jgi:peptidoglycan hydrolase CwlO-like protein
LKDFKRVFDENFERDWTIVNNGDYNQIVLKATQNTSQRLRSLITKRNDKEKELSSLETTARHVSDIFSSEETASELTSINLEIAELNNKIDAAKKELSEQNKKHLY